MKKRKILGTKRFIASNAEAAGTSATAIAAATPGSGKASNKQTRDAQAASASPDNDAAESALAIVNRPVRDKWAIVIVSKAAEVCDDETDLFPGE